jgi:hypothetical protein
VGEKLVKGNVASSRIRFAAGVCHELRNDADDGSFEFEQAAFVEHHRHGCRGDGFGDRGKVEKSGRRDRGGTAGGCVIRETAKGLPCDETILVRDCDRSGREGALRDRFAEDGESKGKGFILTFESRDESWNRAIQSVDTREKFVT